MSPFGLVGGKSKLAKDIVALMPKHRLYVEVFGGALNVLYTKEKPILTKGAEVVNDINGELRAFAKNGNNLLLKNSRIYNQRGEDTLPLFFIFYNLYFLISFFSYLFLLTLLVLLF